MMKNCDNEFKAFKVANTENSTVTRISFEISRQIAASRKSFTSGNFKVFMLIATRIISKEKNIPKCQSLTHDKTEKNT